MSTVNQATPAAGQLKAATSAAPLNLSLLGFFLKRHRVLILVIALCVAAYSVMIIALWPFFVDDSFQELMEQMAASMPGFDTSAFSMTLGQYLETQWLGVYFLPLAGAVMIVFAARALAGGVADGSLETIFSAPIKRTTYLNTLVLVLLIIAALLSIATIVPLVLCAPLFDTEISISSAVLLLVTCWLVLFVFGLIVLAVSAWTRGVALPACIAVAVILVMLVLYAAVPMVEALEILEPVSLLFWWSSGGIIDNGEVAWGLWVWLAVVGVAGLAVSYAGFLRRDVA